MSSANPPIDEDDFIATLDAELQAMNAEIDAVPIAELEDLLLSELDFSMPPPAPLAHTCARPLRHRKCTGTEKISLRVPARVLNAYRDDAARKGGKYQTLINRVLMENMPR